MMTGIEGVLYRPFKGIMNYLFGSELDDGEPTISKNKGVIGGSKSPIRKEARKIMLPGLPRGKEEKGEDTTIPSTYPTGTEGETPGRATGRGYPRGADDTQGVKRMKMPKIGRGKKKTENEKSAESNMLETIEKRLKALEKSTGLPSAGQFRYNATMTARNLGYGMNTKGRLINDLLKTYASDIKTIGYIDRDLGKVPVANHTPTVAELGRKQVDARSRLSGTMQEYGITDFDLGTLKATTERILEEFEQVEEILGEYRDVVGRTWEGYEKAVTDDEAQLENADNKGVPKNLVEYLKEDRQKELDNSRYECSGYQELGEYVDKKIKDLGRYKKNTEKLLGILGSAIEGISQRKGFIYGDRAEKPAPLEAQSIKTRK